jgi:hypothetical protein
MWQPQLDDLRKGMSPDEVIYKKNIKTFKKEVIDGVAP